MLYFAYGSNLSMKQMQQRCPGAVPLRRHTQPEMRLVLRGVADVEDAPGKTVEGAIYRLTPEHVATLDGYEGVPTVYERRFFVADGESVLFYQMVVLDFRKPREGYIATIEAGFVDWGIPMETLQDAVARQSQQYGGRP